MRKKIAAGAAFLLMAVSSSASFAADSSSSLLLADAPLFTGQSVPPMVMLVMGRDHTLFYEAYNDASDLNGDGKLDIRFTPKIAYYGYFDPNKCYTYANGLFSPSSKSSGEEKKCSGTWSGNFLNYLTMTRMDVLRKVLYGGYRSTDSSNETILERSFIPQDAHSWAKSYTSVTVDEYDIASYTPYSQPDSGKQHFFGTTTYVDYGNPPVLRVIKNASNAKHRTDWGVWYWASTEQPVLSREKDDDNHLNNIDVTVGKAGEEYTVRVAVCVSGLLEANCQLYPNGGYKPVGVLHQYGESGKMDFGLITGSYNKNLSGGVLRKAVSEFASEINSNTGQFNLLSGGIVDTINKITIPDFEFGNGEGKEAGGFQYKEENCGWIGWGPLTNGKCTAWGNPIGEMLYESMRYFAGAGAPSGTYFTSGGTDGDLLLPVASWDDPYASREYCARPVNLVISDIKTSYDSDELPGVNSNFDSSYSGSVLPNFSVTSLLTTISTAEKIDGKYFIGESTDDSSGSVGAPTPKTVKGLGNIRGLAPAEPTKGGGYSVAAAAYYGLKTDLQPNLQGRQSTQTLVVSLASSLPEVKVKLKVGEKAYKTITIVPFAKSVDSRDPKYGIHPEGIFQPTNTIVDWYIEKISETEGSFRINFEDVEQGADHDMDMVVKYSYKVVDYCDGTKDAAGKCTKDEVKALSLTLDSTYAYGGIRQHAGYVISGTTQDGLYLDVKDQNDADSSTDTAYYLDTPTALEKPYPLNSRTLSHNTDELPYSRTRIFVPNDSVSATVGSFLPSPLWYAAKWGGFTDAEPKDNKPGSSIEWDENNDGVPDSYFPVTNANQLPGQLRKALDKSFNGNRSTTAPVFSSNFLQQGTLLYQSSFEGEYWSGDIKAFKADADGDFSATAEWSAAALLDEMTVSNRLIFSRNDTSNQVFLFEKPTQLIGSNDAFSDDQIQQLLNGIGGTDEEKLSYLQAVVNYLRGDRSSESAAVTNPMRERKSVLGDVINSTPYYVAKSNGHDVGKELLVFGANDGMVHLLDAENGKELVAYVPSQIYGKLNDLTDTTYTHEYFVDGGVTAYTDPDTGRTIVVGTLGTGGRGLYAIDVTNMSTPSKNMMLWEIDPQTAGFSGLGYTTAAPTIAKLANGQVGVVFANGYNAGDGEGTIFIVDLYDGTLIQPLTTGKTFSDDPSGNGWSSAVASPAVVDLDSDNVADRIYAGDIYGNIWAFDISDPSTANWKKATDDGKPLFVTSSPTLSDDNKYLFQPITTKPSVGVHPDGLQAGVLVAFGTGKYIEAADNDADDQPTQSFYVIWDKLDGSVVASKRILATGGKHDLLLAQEILKEDEKNRLLSENQIDWNEHLGFYLDLINTDNNNTDNLGERQITDSVLLGNKVIFTTLLPSTSVCDGGGSGWYMELNIHTGQTWYKGATDLSDLDGDNPIPDDSSHQVLEGIPTSPNVLVVPPAPDQVPSKPKQRNCVTLSTGEVVCFDDNKSPVGRLSWRQLF